MILRIELPEAIDKCLAAEVEKESAYVSPHLRKLSVTADLAAVEVEVGEGAPNKEVLSKVERYLQAMLSRFPKIENKVYFRNKRRNQAPLTPNVYDELKRREWLFELGSGHIGFAGPALALMRQVDATFTNLYRKHLGAAERMYPALIKADLLLKCGYFDSHPNLVSLVTHVIDDFDAIEEFRQANAETNELCIPNPQAIATPHICLNPAACLPCYPSFEGQTIGEDGRVLTWLGRVFRYESKNITGLERLWEFNQRELVFIGTDEFVTSVRQQVFELIAQQITQWDLECHIEMAADAFFATVSAAKTFYEKSLETKAEIRLAIDLGADGEARSIAAGSINLHQNFFGDRFNITAADGQPAITGCVGLGIERWVLAIFAQHGFDPIRWPDSLRADVFE